MSKFSEMEIGRRIQNGLAIEAIGPVKVRQIASLAELL
jgi:hypothetical protein